MKKHIELKHLAVGMFLEAQVLTAHMNDGEARYFLAPEGVSMSAGRRRPRLMDGKHEKIAREGGLLIASQSQLRLLKRCGLTSVYINTQKGDDLPDHVQPLPDEDDVPEAKQAKVDTSTKDETPEPTAEVVVESQPSEDIPVAPGAERHLFGRKKCAWMDIEISEDAQTATLRAMTFGGDAKLGKDEVFHELVTGCGIRKGIDRERVAELAAQAAANVAQVIRADQVIAQGTPPGEVVDGYINYKFLDAQTPDLPYKALKAAFEQDALTAVLAPDLVTRLVAPDEELAEVIPPQGGSAGQDLYGNRRRPAGKEASRPNAGANVRMSGDRYITERYGYVCVMDDEISVISPIWISSDLLEAHFVSFPRIGPEHTLEKAWIMDLLQGVVQGVQEETIDKLSLNLPGQTKKTSLLLAQGTLPVAGQEARFEYPIDPNARKNRPICRMVVWTWMPGTRPVRSKKEMWWPNGFCRFLRSPAWT